MKRSTSRREFLKSAAASAGSLMVLPSGLALGYAANEKVGVAMIGVAGVAQGNRHELRAGGANIVALCDADKGSLSRVVREEPQAKTWSDYRKMLDQQKEIDAVFVSTPDHIHAPASMRAIKMGKHVATEKPLAHNVYEARALGEAAKKHKVATQMDNEGHSGDAVRSTVEWLEAGVIGQVTEVHIWTNRPIWPQAVAKRPAPTPVPPNLDWDLWLGPAPYRDYHPGLHPFSWRGWWDFGTGALGDMGCHYFDAPFWGLKLGHPKSVESVQEGNNAETGPRWSIVTYQFPARGHLTPVTLKWYDGGKLPPKPEELRPGETLADNGTIFVGTKGKLLTNGMGPPRLLGAKPQDFQPPARRLPRPGNHKRDWLDAVRRGIRSGCDFAEYGGPLAEVVLLGNVSIRAGKRIEWDPVNLRIPNAPDAEQYLRREYRKGWEL
jgi:predicted dehydrogenase